jgi:hypothetical protein
MQDQASKVITALNQFHKEKKKRRFTSWRAMTLSFCVFFVCIRDCNLTVAEILTIHGLQENKYTFSIATIK